jgi:hypothetical protein
LLRSQNHLLANCVVPYQLNLWVVPQFCPWNLLNLSPTFPSLEKFISLDLMLLPNMKKSPVNLLSSTHLGGCKLCIEFKQESIAQLSLGIELCSLVVCLNFRIASLLILNLVTTFTCCPSLVWCFFGQPNLCQLKFLIGCMFGNGVTISILQCRNRT